LLGAKAGVAPFVLEAAAGATAALTAGAGAAAAAAGLAGTGGGAALTVGAAGAAAGGFLSDFLEPKNMKDLTRYRVTSTQNLQSCSTQA
jgi:hypothetical protein